MASTKSISSISSISSIVDRNLRAQKRTRRELNADEIKTLHKRKINKISTTIKSERFVRSKSKLSKIFLMPEAVICQMFAFLTVKEHCALSLSSEKLSRLSLLNASSPYRVTIPTTKQLRESKKFLELIGAPSSLFDDYLTDTIAVKMITQRLLRFRPHNLSLQMHPVIEWDKLGAMTQLRELSVQSDTHAPVCLQVSSSEWKWLSHLTNLIKLTLPDTARPSIRYLPSSLTEVTLLDDDRHQEATKDFGDSMIIRSLFTAAHLASLQVVKSACGVIISPYQDQDQDQYRVQISQSFQSLSQSFPALRRLEYGLLGVDSVGELKFLLTFPQLQDLSVSCNYDQVCDWAILAGIPSLRKLRLTEKEGYHHYNNLIPVNIFDSIRQISQLTHLDLNFESDLKLYNPTIFENTTAALKHLATPVAQVSELVPNIPLPNLQTLILGNGFTMTDARFLSVFSSLTAIQLPVTVEHFPEIPNLHTLNVFVGSRISGTGKYKDQLRHVNILWPTTDHNLFDDQIAVIILMLCQMEKLVTLGLSACAREKYLGREDFKKFRQKCSEVLIIDYLTE